jgi:oxygen-independent coproporphyrinogen-3 oxidase
MVPIHHPGLPSLRWYINQMFPGNGPEQSELPRWLWPRAAYVHIPFCAHHCGYCDFAVATGQDHLVDLYLEALSMELATLQQPQRVQTIFLGGGTPTYLSAAQLARLLETIAAWLPLAEGGEFSVEANPGTLASDKIAVLADHGVNRLSLGAQSFHPQLLRVLERDHKPADVPTAVEAVRRRIRRLSLDLIFGVPGQTLADWQNDLNQALSLKPDHVSTYGLTYEKGTRLWKQERQGEVRRLNEDNELELYACAIDTLQGNGFEHYEISSFAKPDCRCRHNQVYWANEAYFGFGMGAARNVQGRRELNTRHLHGYIRKVLSGDSPIIQCESLEPVERARETMALQLRRREGIQRDEYYRQTGLSLDAVAGPAVARHVALEMLEDDGARVALTRKGKYVADAVIQGLLKVGGTP